MATTTTRVSLTKPAAADTTVIRTDFNSNMDLIDSAVGAEVVTSSTRPSSGYSGKLIYESDRTATLVRDGSNWKYISAPVVALASTVTATHAGQLVVQTTDSSIQVSTGSAWKYISVPIASTITSIVPAHAGLLGVQSSDMTLKVYTGSAWTNVTSTASTIPGSSTFSHYEFTTTASTTSGSDYWPLFNSDVTTSTYVTKGVDTGESTFTFNTTGLYEVQAQAVWATNSVGYRVLAVNSTLSNTTRYGGISIPASGSPLAYCNMSFSRIFTAGQAVQMVVQQNSGGSLNLTPAANGLKTWISFRYIP